jgi:hypothetical protein
MSIQPSAMIFERRIIRERRWFCGLEKPALGSRCDIVTHRTSILAREPDACLSKISLKLRCAVSAYKNRVFWAELS